MNRPYVVGMVRGRKPPFQAGIRHDGSLVYVAWISGGTKEDAFNRASSWVAVLNENYVYADPVLTGEER